MLQTSSPIDPSEFPEISVNGTETIKAVVKDFKKHEERIRENCPTEFSPFLVLAMCINEFSPPEKINIWIKNLMEKRERSVKSKQCHFYSFDDIQFHIPSQSQTTLRKEPYDLRWLKRMKFHARCRTIFTMRYPSPHLKNSTPQTTDNTLPSYPTIRE